MQSELASERRSTAHVLYDPSLRPAADRIDAAASAGEILVMHTASDDALAYRIYVDEDPPDELRAKVATTTAGVLLRVPGGTLIASSRSALASPPEATPLAIPAGNYLVDAHELAYDWERDIAPVLAAELPAYARERRLRPVASGISIAGLGGAVGGALAWNPLVLGVGAGLVIGGLLLSRAISGPAYQANKAAIAKRFPGLVLVLRRLDDGADLAGHAGKQLSFED